jgi:hypothetical protein
MKNLRRLSIREKLLALCLAIVLAIAGWDIYRHHWTPTQVVSTDHYTVYSTCTLQQTQQTGAVAERLYAAYQDFLQRQQLAPRRHGKLAIKLYQSRDEMRFCNRMHGWVEAFYLRPYCHQYFCATEINPYHWMLHEATHQLNDLGAGLSLPQWLGEGIAEYFSTSRLENGRLVLGKIDTNTYPIWHLGFIARSGDLDTDKRNGSFIPLRTIVAGSGGPPIDEAFNLYYLHWWSLVHFLQHGQDGKYRAGFARLLKTQGGLEDFSREIGDPDQIEREWHAYILEKKRQLMRHPKPAGSAKPPMPPATDCPPTTP